MNADDGRLRRGSSGCRSTAVLFAFVPVWLVGVATVFISFAILKATRCCCLELADYFGRRRRTRMLEGIAGHYIVCGAGRVGRSVVLELQQGGARVGPHR